MIIRFRGNDCKRSSSLTWYDRMDNLLMGLGFSKSKVDSNPYFKVEGGILVILLLYVDDLFLIGEDKVIEDANRILATEFDMKYLGMMHHFLCMEVWHNADGIFLGQGKYAVEIMKTLRILDHKGDNHTYGI